jgi:hypothetical protein
MTHNTSSLDFPASLTSRTSVSGPSVGSKKKKAKSDIQEQVERVNDEIKSLQSDIVSRHSFKHKHFLAKLNTKDYLRKVYAHEAMQATVSHQHEQEMKDAEICLCEMDVHVHKAQALALDKEAEIWHLKIQFHQMTQSGSKASASGGA